MSAEEDKVFTELINEMGLEEERERKDKRKSKPKDKDSKKK